jgi:hypothetical protein
VKTTLYLYATAALLHRAMSAANDVLRVNKNGKFGISNQTSHEIGFGLGLAEARGTSNVTKYRTLSPEI